MILVGRTKLGDDMSGGLDEEYLSDIKDGAEAITFRE